MEVIIEAVATAPAMTAELAAKMLAEPIDGVFEAEVVQMDHQIDGAAATAAPVPVHKFGAGDGKRLPLEYATWTDRGGQARRRTAEAPRPGGWPVGGRPALGVRGRSRLRLQLGPDADALLHVDDVAVFRQPVDQGGGQVIVLEERPPFAEAQVRGDEGRFLFCAAAA